MAFNFPDAPSEGSVFTDTASNAQYVYQNGVWMQISASQMKIGVSKIASGVGTVGGNEVIMTLPSGFQSFELQFLDFQPAVATQLVGSFSWDGGATFPQVASSYYPVYVQLGSTLAVTDFRGTYTTMIIGPSQGLGAAKKGMYRLWIPVPESGGRMTAQFSSDTWIGTEYRYGQGMNVYAGAAFGPANALRIWTTSTFTTAPRWQLNGIS